MISTERNRDTPVLATGLPASPGIACGEIVTTPDAAVAVAEAGRAAILVREETSPDDVHGMARSVGILTSRGGLASHAAVVARGWGIPAVVGAAAVHVQGDVVTIGEQSFRAGDPLAIDGGTGEVFAGTIAGARVVVPEVATLLAWAAELGIPIGDADAGEPARAALGAAAPTAPPATATANDVLRALVVKGYATPEGAATALLSTAAEMAAVLDGLVADGLAEMVAGSFRLTPDGKRVGRERIVADAERWGVGNAAAALDAFLALDHRMKETVTAWQVRDVDGTQTLNDHTDAAYDAAILDDLGALHANTSAWLRPQVAGLPRLAAYLERLGRAAAAAGSGDGRFVASPRVDSYHGIWFELHEDLILIAGRSRADEVAAGRA
jgi:pyruvate,orthophosphate dikinase